MTSELQDNASCIGDARNLAKIIHVYESLNRDDESSQAAFW
ncbi:MAG: hypothetical protein ABSF82_01285 [Candidatus Bathyarchaeia archaeon]